MLKATTLGLGVDPYEPEAEFLTPYLPQSSMNA